MPSSRRTYRYVKAWITERAPVTEKILTLEHGGTAFRAALAHPSTGRGPWPAWIVLHGITRRGLEHTQLVRFMRALASTGGAVLVPEVPEWTEMRLAPDLARTTVLRAIDSLADIVEAAAPPYGLVGFSFGGPHALASLADPEIAGSVAGAVSFGGYCDLQSTLRFMFTGCHELDGEQHHNRPDPYGRWIATANYLTEVPGCEDAGDVAEELRRLAVLAGETGAISWDPVYDPAKEAARARIAPGRRELFDLVAPPSDREPDPAEGARLAERLTEAGLRVDPTMDPKPDLDRVRGPVHILHGWNDHLIPFTEAARMRAALPDDAEAWATVTRLFGHSKQDPYPPLGRTIREVPLFLRAMGRLLSLV